MAGFGKFCKIIYHDVLCKLLNMQIMNRQKQIPSNQSDQFFMLKKKQQLSESFKVTRKI